MNSKKGEAEMGIKKGQYITNTEGKKYKLLEDAVEKKNFDDFQIYIIKGILDEDKRQKYFLKYFYKVGEIVSKNLKRESEFCFHYPYIEHVLDEFDAQDPEKNIIHCVLLEYIEGDNLGKYREQQWERVEKGERKEEEFEREMFQQMMQLLYGVNYYVNCTWKDPFLHRDLNPNNIMITKEGKAVIVDFDNAHISGSKDTIPVGNCKLGGTKGYLDPYILSEKSSKKTNVQSEIYSIGRIFFYWLNGCSYFKEEELIDWFYCFDEDLGYGLEISRFKEKKYLENKYSKLIQIIARMCTMPEKRYKQVKDIINEMRKFFIEYCDNSMKKYVDYIKLNTVPLLQKRLDRDLENAPNVIYQIYPQKEGKKGHLLYSYTMRDILVDNRHVMTIYNLDGKIYYIPYVKKLSCRREEKDFKIYSEDEFIWENKVIKFWIY